MESGSFASTTRFPMFPKQPIFGFLKLRSEKIVNLKIRTYREGESFQLAKLIRNAKKSEDI